MIWVARGPILETHSAMAAAMEMAATKKWTTAAAAVALFLVGMVVFCLTVWGVGRKQVHWCCCYCLRLLLINFRHASALVFQSVLLLHLKYFLDNGDLHRLKNVQMTTSDSSCDSGESAFVLFVERG